MLFDSLSGHHIFNNLQTAVRRFHSISFQNYGTEELASSGNAATGCLWLALDPVVFRAA